MSRERGWTLALSVGGLLAAVAFLVANARARNGEGIAFGMCMCLVSASQVAIDAHRPRGRR